MNGRGTTRRLKLMLVGAMALYFASANGFAQVRYVSDELVITFRTGPGSQFAITRNLTSGDRVEVLEEQSDDGYSRVRLSNGDVGWVLTRYLQAEPTASTRLATVTSELEESRQTVETLNQRVATLEAELNAAKGSLDDSEAEADALDAELADIRKASANALQMRDENEALQTRVADLSSRIDAAQSEVNALRRRERQNWFIIGAAVLLGGIVIGLVAPSLRPKRRSSW
jgi:SH3 domain protein